MSLGSGASGASQNDGRSYSFKTVLLGEGCVGKTSLILRYVANKFNDKHDFTKQASYLNKKINIGGKRVKLAIWDTAGQEKFHALGPIYYRDSNGAILVYDITNDKSFQKVQNWVKELRKMLGDDICLAIAGNKIDLDKERHVDVSDAESYAESVGAKHFHTSAKHNKGIDDMFLDISKRMIEKADSNMQNKKTSTTNRKSIMVVDDEQMEQKAKGGCC